MATDYRYAWMLAANDDACRECEAELGEPEGWQEEDPSAPMAWALVDPDSGNTFCGDACRLTWEAGCGNAGGAEWPSDETARLRQHAAGGAR